MGKSDERFIEFITDRISESAINTFTQEEIALPTSKTEMMAFLLHTVDIFVETPTFVASTNVSRRCQLTLDEATGMDWYNAFRLIATLSRDDHWGALIDDPCPRSGFSYGRERWVFDPPLLIARDHIYAAVVGHNETTVCVSDVRLGYTLERVSREAFIAALVS